MKTIHIIGGGITGCSLAFFLKDKFKIVLYEKKDRLGGLCSTEYNMEGLQFQKGAHILHTNENWIISLLSKAVDLKKIEYTVGINPLFDMKTYSYPFNKKAIESMPWHWKEAIKLDLQNAQGCSADNLEDLITNFYGATIYEQFYKNYLKKAFGPISNDIFKIGWFQKFLKPVEETSSYFSDPTYFPIGSGYEKVFSYFTTGVTVKLNTLVEASCFSNKDIVICTGRGDYFLNKKETDDYVKYSFDVDSTQYDPTAFDTNIFPNHTPFISITQFGKMFPHIQNKNLIVKDFPGGNEEAIPPVGKTYTPLHANMYFAGRQGSCKMFDMADCIKQANQIAGIIKHKEGC